ncbi:unnamed protein product [Thlaspi arvense]|uniref:KIB1-4 beta-propeller domain-containing protein n=1 Tax=Thlaspi arvense TaxID=13288 RepID=A0AAU9SMJ4_THLAR|nr:unnamed protein product [Thlaspi arvense]
MSLLLSHPSKICFRKPVFLRSSPLHSNGFSSSSLPQTPPCQIIDADPCGADVGRLIIKNISDRYSTYLEKKVPMELLDPMVTIGASHGWVATLKDDGILRLQDDLNPAASDTDPKRISLPPLMTLPHCQTQVVANVVMSSPSPEGEDCVVPVKFLGPQLSFCRPGQSNSEWINVKIENPCFFSSPVMYSKKDDMFRIPGSGCHLIGSWDLHEHSKNPKLQSLQFINPPKVMEKKSMRVLLDSCYTSEHLVESRTRGETFLVKLYKKTARIIKGVAKMKTEVLVVFKLDEVGNAVFTKIMGDVIFLSKSEPFCLPASSFPGMYPSTVRDLDVHESAYVNLPTFTSVNNIIYRDGSMAPYYIPPQNID